MILAIITDKPEAELYLLESAKGEVAASYKWEAHRSLADTLLSKVTDFLTSNEVDINSLRGIVVFTGQGSFTGLRIGTALANALAYSSHVPITKASGNDWLKTGAAMLVKAKTGAYVVPDYDGEPNIS